MKLQRQQDWLISSYSCFWEIIASSGLYFSKKFLWCAEYLRVITAQRFRILKKFWNPSKLLSLRNVSSWVCLGAISTLMFTVFSHQLCLLEHHSSFIIELIICYESFWNSQVLICPHKSFSCGPIFYNGATHCLLQTYFQLKFVPTHLACSQYIDSRIDCNVQIESKQNKTNTKPKRLKEQHCVVLVPELQILQHKQNCRM